MSDTLAEPTEETAFLDLHKKFVGEKKPNSALQAIQEAALSRFETLGFPHSKHEMYTYVNTKNLAAIPFAIFNSSAEVSEGSIASHVYPSCENSCLVFVNGVLNSSLSKLKGIEGTVKISSLTEKVDTDYVLASLENENDVFACLANAFCEDATVIEIADKTQVPVPIQVLFVSSGDTAAPVIHAPKLIWKIGKLAEVKVIEKSVGLQAGFFFNITLDWVISVGAGVVLTQVQADPFVAWNFFKTLVYLKRDARFHSPYASSWSVLFRLPFLGP
ncbi:MAG: Fe-S cluster assembly protein SufD, partial [Nitrospinae bacterium]|nr:Fe-S cluster assembly protein SufD [Nitrospinota bacterium]